MFVGWEGVGFCSWGLIGFWHKELPNTTAGNKAFIVNRIGDFGFVLGIFLLFWSLDARGHGTLVFRELREHAHLLAGAVFWGVPVARWRRSSSSSAPPASRRRFPSTSGCPTRWRADAGLGADPRRHHGDGRRLHDRPLNFLFALAPATLAVVATIGAPTALLAATIALAQNDIKKVLAYSTVSQLGYMFLAMGVGAYAAGIFHLMTHAFFKACLFLGSGSVIHAWAASRTCGRWAGCAEAPGRPPPRSSSRRSPSRASRRSPGSSRRTRSSGRRSRARSAAAALGRRLLVAFLTAFYMFRQVFMVFFGECRATTRTQHHLHESPSTMTLPLRILAALGRSRASCGSRTSSCPSSTGSSPSWGIRPRARGGRHRAVAHARLGRSSPSGIGLAWMMYCAARLGRRLFSEAARRAAVPPVYNKYYVDELYELSSCAAAWRSSVVRLVRPHVIDGIVNLSAPIVRVSVASGRSTTGCRRRRQRRRRRHPAVGPRIRNLQTGAISAYSTFIVFGVLGGVLLYWSWAVASWARGGPRMANMCSAR
jgi:NADH-quinone oxidoreductase subunit L